MATSDITDDTTLLLTTFPEEVWRVILGKVKDVLTFQNASSATPLLCSLLLPRKMEILFPEAVKVYLEQLPTLQLQQNSRKGCAAHILNLRQVCRGSRNAVDEWLQAQDFYSKYQYDKFTRGWEPQFGMGYTKVLDKFTHMDHFEEFEQYFDPTHLDEQANPFLSRGIVLCIPPEPFLETYYNACTHFLWKYGHHIWYCRIFPNIAKVPLYTRRLQSIMERMPNLRGLLIHASRGLLSTALEPSYEVTPFPRLQQLHSVCARSIPDVVLKGLLESNPQVRQVDAWDSNYTKLCVDLLPNLTAACLPLQNNFDIFDSVEAVGQVERLWLHISCMDDQIWERMCQVLKSKFSGRLTELHIRLPTVYGQVATGKGLTLPNLKKLELKIRNPLPLDFLLPMRDTLEQLHIHVDDSFRVGVDKEKHATIKLYRFWKNPIRSTIWDHFPNLKLVRLVKGGTFMYMHKETYSCTRTQWMDAPEAIKYYREKSNSD